MSDLSHYTNTSDAIDSVIFGFCTFILAYSFGLLEAIAACLRRVGLLVWSRRVAIVTTVCFHIVAVVVLADAMVETARRGVLINNWLIFLLMIVVPVSAFIHMWRSRKLGTRRWICQSFMVSALCLIWFSYWFVLCLFEGSGRYGLYLSWASSAILTLAVVGEARVVARKSWLKTVGLLIISRLPEGYRAGYCPQCDYNLFGLTEPRCPECGRPFTFDELRVSPEELGYQLGSSKPDSDASALPNPAAHL